NMTDEARARGLAIDSRRLAQILGAEVVETVAVRKEGLSHLRAAFTAPHPIGYRIHYDGALELGIEQISRLLPAQTPGPRAIALMILAGDTRMTERWGGGHQAELQAIAAQVAAGYDQPLAYLITQQRLRCADCLVPQVLHTSAPSGARSNW